VAVAVVDVQVNSQGAVRNLQQVNAASKAATAGIGTLRNAVAGLVAGFSAIQTAKFVFAKTAELESQTRSIQTLTGSVQQAKQIIQELQQLGAATPFTGTELIESAKRLTAFGVSAKDVVETTRRLGDVAGATGANLGELTLAYGQVIAKGRLQGEELLQFQERGVALQDELRKMYGLTGEEFSKALSKGQISAEAVEVALQRLTDTGGKYANGAIAQSDTLNGRFSTLQDGVEALARRIGQVLTPALKAIFNQAIAVVDAINAALAAGRGGGFTRNVAGARQFLNIGATSQAVDNIAKGVGQISSQANRTGIQQNLQALQQYQRLLQSIGPNDPNASRAVQLQGTILDKINENLAAQKRLGASASQTQKLFTPPLLGATGGGGGRSGLSDAEREAKKFADELKRSLEIGDQLGREFSRQTILLASLNEQERKRFEIQFEYEDRARQIGELKNAEQRVNLAALNDEIRRLDLQRLTTEELKAQNDLFLKRAGLVAQVYGGGAGAFRTDIDLLGQQDKALQSVLDKYPQIGEAASAASQLATQGTMEMINGTKSAQQVFADFLNSIVDILMKSAAQMIAQYIAIGVARMFAGVPSSAATGGAKYGASAFSGAGMGSTGFSLPFLGARANGGSVMAGQPYLVGERGPELFMPGRSGGIARAGSFGGGANIVVNVDAGGSSVQGDSNQGKQLGSVIAAAVQAELVKQQRPGGLLAR
jgi:tape measure domain-containing protein